MTNRDRIRVLRELKEWPLQTLKEKPAWVEEALNWAIKICDKFESNREVKK